MDAARPRGMGNRWHGRLRHRRPRFGTLQYGRLRYRRPEFGWPEFGWPELGRPVFGWPGFGRVRFGRVRFGTVRFGSSGAGRVRQHVERKPRAPSRCGPRGESALAPFVIAGNAPPMREGAPCHLVSGPSGEKAPFRQTHGRFSPARLQRGDARTGQEYFKPKNIASFEGSASLLSIPRKDGG